jgi:hypothetical protein
MDNFYVVLPSNTPTEGNKTSHYTVRLPEELNLDSNWTVALSSIIYPISFTSLGTQENQFITIKKDVGPEEKISVPSMNYLTITNLENGINDAISSNITETSRPKRSIMEEEGDLKTPETVEESPETIAAVEEFLKKQKEGIKTKETETKKTSDPQTQETVEESPQTIAAVDEHKNKQIEKDKQATKIELKSETIKEGLKIPEPVVETAETIAAVQDFINKNKDRTNVVDVAAASENKIEEIAVKERVALSKEDQKKIDTAKRAGDRAWNQIKAAITETQNLAENSRALRQKSELLRRKFPDIVKDLYEQLFQKSKEIQFDSEKITEQAKVARTAKDDLDNSYIEGNVLGARKATDIIKKVEKEVNIIMNNSGRLYSGYQENNFQDGVRELSNRIKSLIDNTLPEQRVEKLDEDVEKILDDELGEIILVPGIIEDENIGLFPKIIPNKKEKEKKPTSISNLPIIEIDDRTDEWTIITKGTKIEKKKEVIPSSKWSLNKKDYDEMEIFSPKKIIETINKKPQPVHIKGFYIPDDDDQTSLDSLPELPTPQALTQEKESSDLTIPEQVHENLRKRLEQSSLRKRLEKIRRLSNTQSPKQIIEFKYDSTYQKFYVIMRQGVKSIKLSDQLAYILGYRNNIEITPGEMAEYMPDLSGGVKQLYVYAPKLVENTMVGDQMVPLLRVINVQGKPGEIVESIYSSEFHHRLQTKRISDITIEIRTSNGEFINFHWGNTVLTLHFKRSLF